MTASRPLVHFDAAPTTVVVVQTTLSLTTSVFMFLNSTSLLIWIFDNRFKPPLWLAIYSVFINHVRVFLYHVSCTQICTCSIFLRKIDKWGPRTLMEAIFLAGCHHSSLADTLFDYTVPLLFVYFLFIISFEKKVFSGLFVFFNCKQKIVGFFFFFSCRILGRVTHSCIGSSERGPTELLQGWKSAEVGFDGRLIGRWQVGQALEGAWERQVIWLRLWRQDAAYPIVFWRQIHTLTDKEKGREKIGQAIFKKKKVQDHHGRPPTERERDWAGGRLEF